AEELGLIGTNLYSLANVAEPITRKEMALIIIRAYRKFEKDQLTYEDCKHLEKEIKDFDKIPPLYQPYVLIAYGSGIISGYSDGRFGPDDTATRAQAAAFIIRYLDPRERADVGLKKDKTREPMELRYDDPYRPMAQEGDIFIKPDGTEVILKVGPAGVLGELQGVATEIGRIDRGGTPLQHGDLGTEEEVLGQPYLVDEKTGEGHYLSEWDKIRQYYLRKALQEIGHPEDGTYYGPWFYYYRGKWIWAGP
ncbi:MAG: S-layer homology domain-containing protein, partial [Clostridiaceae bacterium]|nr:S-layer homology domain-containing protein [Clostridiaceae bacterium]